MLPDGPEVEQAILGQDGVLEGAQAGTIVVDMSSISPMVSQKVAAACAQKGVEFLDAPVSGGEPKAIDGTLAIMVGGKQEVFDKVAPILQKMGSSVTLTGAVGAGNVTKLANQIMVACNIAAMGEALVLATSAGSTRRWCSTPSRAGWPEHRAERQSADGDRAQFQAWIPHPAASEGSAQRAAGSGID